MYAVVIVNNIHHLLNECKIWNMLYALTYVVNINSK